MSATIEMLAAGSIQKPAVAAVAPTADYTAGKATVELRGVRKGFGHDGEREEVVEDLSLTIKPGQLTALVGPSGCGKSTIVNLVAGYERPDQGEILIDGRKITGSSQDRMVVFQESALFPWLTTRQNITFGPRLRGDMPAEEIEAEANRLLTRVGLTEFRDKYPTQLSGGMQRRAELARAMMNRPRLMIMDEPFRGLDAMTRKLMQIFFLRLFEENRRTNLFVTSEIEEAILLADRLVILSNRPTKVARIVDVTLPRPRDFHMLSSREGYDYKREALAILHKEAQRSFSASGKDFADAFTKRYGEGA
jgi:NitT/TauT family transport system ATP-binding protein